MIGIKLENCREYLSDLDLKLLEEGEKWGYKGLAVSVHDDTVESSHYWAKQNVEFLCGEPDPKSEKKGKDDSWPAVWRIADKLGGSAGCGNSQQKQLNHNHGYTRVSYRKSRGTWKVYGLPQAIYRDQANKMKSKFETETEDHIENVKAIISSMRHVHVMIKREGKEKAFKEILGAVDRWEIAVKNAIDHISSSSNPMDTLTSQEKLKELLDKLEKQKTYDRFRV